MPSMTPMMSAIRRLDSVICVMVLTICSTAAPPRAAASLALLAMSLAWRDDSALFSTVERISSIDAAVSCRLQACCSVRRLRSLLPLAISDVPVAICSLP